MLTEASPPDCAAAGAAVRRSVVMIRMSARVDMSL
jgi:hypothetical protein